MKITILAGSPKGDLSTTMQYVNYIKKHFPGHDYRVFNVAQQIKKIEKDPQAFSRIIDEIRTSDAVLWAFPLYYLLVHAGMKRFIELIAERGAADAFTGKYAASLSTSIHFFDQTAHSYIRAISEDLGMRYTGYHSAEMHDLLKEPERRRLILFAEDFFSAAEHKTPTTRLFAPVTPSTFRYKPAAPVAGIDPGSKKIVVITDTADDKANITAMVGRFSRSLAAPPRGRQPQRYRYRGGMSRLHPVRLGQYLRVHGQGRLHRLLQTNDHPRRYPGLRRGPQRPLPLVTLQALL